jgi:hypothetical protein
MADGTWYQANDDGTTTPLGEPPPVWRGGWGAPSPPEEAYGRVTDPGRYGALHAAGRDLLDRLTADHAVDRDDGDASLDPALTGGVTAEAVVRLGPRSPDAAPLTVAFTSFPGLVVRFGHWVVRPFPWCGCDACAEEPDHLVDELTAGVAALVAGRFTERLTGSGRRRRLAYRLGDVEVDGQGVDARTAAHTGGPADRSWSAWPRRTTA